MLTLQEKNRKPFEKLLARPLHLRLDSYKDFYKVFIRWLSLTSLQALPGVKGYADSLEKQRPFMKMELGRMREAGEKKWDEW